MANELWNKRREMLEEEVQQAAMRLFEHMGEPSSFLLRLHPDSEWYVAFGTKEEIAEILKPGNPIPYLGKD